MTRIIILTEDTPVEGLQHEHGLSMLVETDKTRVLFDTGHTDVFLRNAATLGVSLDNLDAVVISHPHYDHAGGLRHLSLRAPLYVSDGFFRPRYRIRDGESIGSPCSEARLRNEGFRLRPVVDFEKLPGGLCIVTGFHQPHPLERHASAYAFDPEGLHPDSFAEELMLAVPVPSGYLALGGCCHPGIIGMLERCCQSLEKPVVGFVGGMHLRRASEDRIRATAVALGGCHLKQLHVGHCTGDKAATMLEELTDLRIERLQPGIVLGVG